MPVVFKKILAATALGASLVLTSLAAERPNIIFVFTDDHSLQTIGAYDARLSQFCREQNITPNLDRLAASGGLFVNSFCGNSICSPSRATVLTGMHSHGNGVKTLFEPLNKGIWTFPKSLRAAGYQTAVIGKWHLIDTLPEFDDWWIMPKQGNYNNPDFDTKTGNVKHKGYVSDVVTDMALDWVKKRDAAKPFFLAVYHKAPHRNWTPPARYASWLDGVTVPEPATLFDDYTRRASPVREQRMTIRADMTLDSDLKIGRKFATNPMYAARNAEFAAKHPKGDELTRWKYQQYMKDYLRCVKSVDDGIGRILEELKTSGLETNTVVIYSSDQGFYMGEHGWFDKRWIYEESLHMPFIIRWPDVVKPGTRFTSHIQNIDYAPTFVDMAGGKIPDGLHGKSLVPVLRGETPADWRQSIYYHYYDHHPEHNVAKHYGVRNDRYTLAYFYETAEWELFDRQKDPDQLRSVYNDSAYAAVVKEMKTELTRLRNLYQDNEPKKPAPAKPRRYHND